MNELNEVKEFLVKYGWLIESVAVVGGVVSILNKKLVVPVKQISDVELFIVILLILIFIKLSFER